MRTIPSTRSAVVAEPQAARMAWVAVGVAGLDKPTSHSLETRPCRLAPVAQAGLPMPARLTAVRRAVRAGAMAQRSRHRTPERRGARVARAPLAPLTRAAR